MRTAAFIIFALPLAWLASACAGGQSRTEIDVEKVIAEKVQERVDEFRRSQQADCQQRARLEAGLLADSILLERARLLRDTSYRPPRPLKPGQPELKTLSDSLRLAPLFDSLR
jgi:hypothetical protein